MRNSKLKTQNSKLSEKEVRHVAKLAKLNLTSSEVKKFKNQLSEVLEYINILKKLDTQKIGPTNQVTGLENVFREDKVGPSLSSNEVLANTKEKHHGLFVVKAIFKKK